MEATKKKTNKMQLYSSKDCQMEKSVHIFIQQMK